MAPSIDERNANQCKPPMSMNTHRGSLTTAREAFWKVLVRGPQRCPSAARFARFSTNLQHCDGRGMVLPVRTPTSRSLRLLVAVSLTAGAASYPGSSNAAKDELPQWVTAKPSPATQQQKTAKERGINPCMSPDPGFGVYGQWRRDVAMGQYIQPARGGIRRDGGFDVMFHFHGHEAVRKEWVTVMDGAVLASVDLGIGSGAYENAFVSPTAFEGYLRSVESAVSRRTNNTRAHATHIGLSAWSAGYGAVQKILEQPLGRRVDAVVLLDALHAGYVDGHVNGLQIASVVDFAKRAATGQGFFFFSHSSIIPPGYASTTETAHWLIWSVGGKPLRARRRTAEVMGLDLISRFDREGFHERGYSGNDKMDHCAHIGLYRDVLQAHIVPRWKSPRGRGEPAAATPNST